MIFLDQMPCYHNDIVGLTFGDFTKYKKKNLSNMDRMTKRVKAKSDILRKLQHLTVNQALKQEETTLLDIQNPLFTISMLCRCSAQPYFEASKD